MARDLPPPFSLSPAAQAHLMAELAKTGTAPAALRIAAKAAGCSGFKTVFSVAAQPEPLDRAIAINGLQFYIDPKAEMHIIGATLDLVRHGLETRLEFVNNPNIAGTCGCGASYLPKNPDKTP